MDNNYDVGNIFINIKSQTDGFDTEIDSAIKQLNKMKSVLAKLEKIDLSKTATSLKGLFDSVGTLGGSSGNKVKLPNVGSSGNSLFAKTGKLVNRANLMFGLNYVRKILTATIKLGHAAVDYNEALNKFQVSMGDYYGDALKFVNNLTKAFNLSSTSIMNYQATFKNMLDALGGLGEDYSYELSKTLTRMGVDFASLFNVSVDRAMSVLQSAMSGQVRGIRAISGFDVTQNTYFQLYQQMGGTKTIRQLTQVEKRLLIILALQKQMEETGAVGDFEKTINYTANTLKQLAETLQEVAMYIGQFILVYMKPLITNLLGGAIAIRELLSSAYETFGGKELEENVEGVTNKFTNMSEEVTGLIDETKELTKAMLGFDKINKLGSSDSSNIMGSDIGLIVNELGKYQELTGSIETEAKNISKRIIEWAKNLGNVLDIAKSFAVIAGTISLVFLTNKNQILTLFKGFSSFSGAIFQGGATNVISALIAGLKTLTGIPIIAFLTMILVSSEDLRTSLGKIAVFITEVLVKAFSWFGKIYGVLEPIFKAIGDGLAIVLDGIVWLLENIPFLSDVLGVALVVITGIVIAMNMNPFALWTMAIVALISIFGNLIKAIQETWDTSKSFGENIANLFKKIANWFIGGINDIIKGINSIKIPLPQWIKDLTGWGDIGFNIPEIPKLAKGGVLYSEQMVTVGEYPNARTNPEIVAPQSIIEETVMQANAKTIVPLTNAVINKMQEILVATKQNKNNEIYLNGRKVSENLYGDMQQVEIRKGKALSY